jgi:LAGLIDADG endonuclease
MSAIPWVGQDIVELNFTDSYVTAYSLSAILPTIGTVNINALKKGNKVLRLNKQEYLSIPPSFLSFLVGLIDGDGYIQITKTSKGFIAIKLVLSLHLKDLSTLEYIHSVLKIGKITVYKDNKSPTSKLVINKTDLQEVLFPLLLHYNIFFLTKTRINQFNLAMLIMSESIKLFEGIPSEINIPNVFKCPNNPVEYTKLVFFNN